MGNLGCNEKETNRKSIGQKQNKQQQKTKTKVVWFETKDF